MRWDELFTDMESQFESQLEAEQLDLAAEEEQLRRGRRSLAERLCWFSRGGAASRIVLTDGQMIELRVDATGADWVAGELRLGEGSRGAIVPVAAIAGVLAAPAQHPRDGAAGDAPRPGGLSARLGFAVVLRDLCRRRVTVDLRTPSGSHRGRIAQVGADHLDLIEYDAEGPEATTRRVRLVPFGGILLVQA